MKDETDFGAREEHENGEDVFCLLSSGPGHNSPGSTSQFATRRPGFLMHCCICVAKKMFSACMLRPRVSV